MKGFPKCHAGGAWYRNRRRCGIAALLVVATVRLSAGEPQEVVAPGAALQRLPGEYSFTEGPAVDPDGNIFFTDQPNDRIVKWNAADGTVEDWLKPAGRSNGMFFDAEGNLVACADGKNQLWSIAPDKQVTVLLSEVGGKLLNGPNDVWIRPDGGIYFTDPLYVRPYWERDKAMQQEGQHVYLFKQDMPRPIPVDTELKQPNGIVGTPDGKTLYVADIGAGKTYAYDIQGDGSLLNKRLFCDMGSDGMTIDTRGNVYLTGRGVTVFDKTGRQIEHIDVPESWTANVTFGGKDRSLLFITAGQGIYGMNMTVSGVDSNSSASGTR